MPPLIFSTSNLLADFFCFSLGKVRDNDIVLLISHSGNTDEVTRAMQLLKKKNIKTLALIGSEGNSKLIECQIQF